MDIHTVTYQIVKVSNFDLRHHKITPEINLLKCLTYLIVVMLKTKYLHSSIELKSYQLDLHFPTKWS